jgi:hypothetical protein
MHIPFLVGHKGLPFTGEDAVDDTKLWKMYITEAEKARPDMKVVHKLWSRFDEHFKENVGAYRAANDWVGLNTVALTMRNLMKTSYSEYYQGPGNSIYSNYGQAMVAKLEKFIAGLTKSNPTLKSDMDRYGWGTPHDLAYDLLEWYER